MLEELGVPEAIAGPLGNVLNAFIVLVVGLVIMKIILHIVRKTMEKSELDQVLYSFVIKIVKIAIWIMLMLVILECFGIKAGSVLTVLAAAGAAIALALKDSLANVAGGIMIMINKPFVQDDYVDINGNMGEVKEIDLFVTHLNTYDNKVITVPNGLINTSILTNYTKENMRRVDCKFSVAYGTDIDKVRDIIRGIISKDVMMKTEPEPRIGVAEHGESSIVMDVLVWCDTTDYWDVKYNLEEAVKNAFENEGIGIPFPQMDVHIKNTID